MKKLLIFLWGMSLWACSSSDITPNEVKRPITTLENDLYTVEFFITDSSWKTGYNPIEVHIKDKSGQFIDLPEFKVVPSMQMQMMSHSSPVSTFEKTDKGKFKGFIIFQMASNEMEFWTLEALGITKRIEVKESSKRVVQSFMGTDDSRYVLAMAEPNKPKVGSQTISAYLYQMKDSHHFVPVNNCKILLDPRMPGMGNHSSPNNQDLLSKGQGLYQGLLNLTMTGYWKLNVVLLNEQGETVKDQIFFELEF